MPNLHVIACELSKRQGGITHLEKEIQFNSKIFDHER